MASKRSKYFNDSEENSKIRTTRKRYSNSQDENSKFVKEYHKRANSGESAICTDESSSKCDNSRNNLIGMNNISSMNRVKDAFYDIPCIELAKRLLGKVLVRIDDDGTVLKGKIVETESYLGGDDKASFSYNGKMTPRNKPMFMKPGTTFIYITYGMYHCFNISCQGDGAAVLLRALEPIEGIERITQNRLEFGKNKKTPSIPKKKPDMKVFQLCNGPGKLCVGFNIDRTLNEKDLGSWDRMWIEYLNDGDHSDVKDDLIVISKRIGIDSVGEPWSRSPLRFYLYDCPSVSKRDKLKEEIVKQNLLNNTN
ncbi:putative 3-methyladenine DNA glycosylase [Lycorma delicatula]|uniref:putative 3-methyladenine DNA glycosylase n=1 Tax=Lycorma delicatula TaxID=130591 RepID=UPI003F519BCF